MYVRPRGVCQTPPSTPRHLPPGMWSYNQLFSLKDLRQRGVCNSKSHYAQSWTIRQRVLGTTRLGTTGKKRFSPSQAQEYMRLPQRSAGNRSHPTVMRSSSLPDSFFLSFFLSLFLSLSISLSPSRPRELAGRAQQRAGRPSPRANPARGGGRGERKRAPRSAAENLAAKHVEAVRAAASAEPGHSHAHRVPNKCCHGGVLFVYVCVCVCFGRGLFAEQREENVRR